MTEDYTLDERQMVKSKVTEAKRKTENEGEECMNGEWGGLLKTDWD